MRWRKDRGPSARGLRRLPVGVFSDGNAAALRYQAEQLSAACPTTYPDGEPFDGPDHIWRVTEAAISIGYQVDAEDAMDFIMCAAMIRAMVKEPHDGGPDFDGMLAAAAARIVLLRQRGLEQEAVVFAQAVDAVLAYQQRKIDR